MIKLIASDMDGTLLQNGSRQVSEKQLERIEKLVEGGILFVPASGRQYSNLRKNFYSVQDRLAYICENGALVKYNGETLYKASLDRQLGLDLMEDIYSKGECEVLLSGEETSYVLPKSEEYVEHLVNYVKNQVTVVKSFEEVKEDFIKISVYCASGIDRYSGYFHDRWGGSAKVTVSGVCWQDFVPLGVHKGSALSCIQERFGIRAEETMSFGDNYNDLEMFERSYYSYAMDSAAKEVKSFARFSAPDVDSVLDRLILGGSMN